MVNICCVTAWICSELWSRSKTIMQTFVTVKSKSKSGNSMPAAVEWEYPVMDLNVCMLEIILCSRYVFPFVYLELCERGYQKEQSRTLTLLRPPSPSTPAVKPTRPLLLPLPYPTLFPHRRGQREANLNVIHHSRLSSHVHSSGNTFQTGRLECD